jgi:hypothetical protein
VSSELVWPGKRREKMGKRRGCGGDGGHFKLVRRGGGRPAGWRNAVGKGRERGGVLANRRTAPDRQRPKSGGCGRRGMAMPCGRPNRGGGRGLTGGPRPQCQAVALADRWARAVALTDRRARAAQCRVRTNSH